MRKLFPTSIPLHQRYVKLISIPNKIQVIIFSSDFIILPRSYRFEKVNNQTDIHVTSLYDNHASIKDFVYFSFLFQLDSNIPL